MSHTEGKLIAWDRGIGFEIHDENGNELNNEFRSTFSEANARRLVACWNACLKFSTEDIERATEADPQGRDRAEIILELVDVRKELDAALGVLRKVIDDTGRIKGDLGYDTEDEIRAILSRYQAESKEKN